MIRQTFEAELQNLQNDLLAMGGQVDRAIERAVRSLVDRDPDLAQQVIDQDVEINHAQRNLEEQCQVLLATQQPLATDLRIILSIANIASELERVGDYAEGIAKLALRLVDRPPIKPLIDIPRMAEEGRRLLAKALQAFVQRDEEAARSVGQGDEVVDALYDQVYRELLVYMMDSPRLITRATYLLWVAHNLERIGDRATNVAERVIFLVSGQVQELNA
jgi:phosphate transport system protein